MAKKKSAKSFKTLALAEKNETDKRTRASIPSEENVETAREWCIENKK